MVYKHTQRPKTTSKQEEEDRQHSEIKGNINISLRQKECVVFNRESGNYNGLNGLFIVV